MLARVALLVVSATVFPLLMISPEEEFDYRSRVGIATFSPDGGGCLTINNASLKGNASVDVILLDKPQVHTKAVIESKSAKPCRRDVKTDPENSFYHLRTPATDAENGVVAFGVASFSGKFQSRDGLVRADLSGNGIEDSFRVCASHEGLHLTVWNGEPLKGARKWHRYLYLGYDVEPDCTEKDTDPHL